VVVHLLAIITHNNYGVYKSSYSSKIPMDE